MLSLPFLLSRRICRDPPGRMVPCRSALRKQAVVRCSRQCRDSRWNYFVSNYPAMFDLVRSIEARSSPPKKSFHHLCPARTQLARINPRRGISSQAIDIRTSIRGIDAITPAAAPLHDIGGSSAIAISSNPLLHSPHLLAHSPKTCNVPPIDRWLKVPARQ